MILTAGPSITEKEITYVNDAVTHGWNERWSEYIVKFEKAFADFIGVKHAMSTSSCTGALHLAMSACGIGKGDEVIVPDQTWVASASVVRYVDATPVFVDVEPDTWTIDPDKVKKAVTARTRAIIPVHLYGRPANLSAIKDIADEHGLLVIEDAAPAIGALHKGIKAGKWGDLAGFSFQGAKMLVTGEGGMLVTNDDDLFAQARHFAEHGRVAKGFDISDIGFKYKMSNIQAALGLGQLERVDELIAKKETLFNWYLQRLGDVEGLSLNKPNDEDTKSIYWMSSIVLDRDFGISRDQLQAELKAVNIDTRPFFPAMSSFPMFSDADTPVAHHLAEKGINLPSGHALTEEEIDYICHQIKRLLKVS